jgi:hypothetical protein
VVDDEALRTALARLLDEGVSTRDAVAELSATYDAPKRRVYELAINFRSSR